MAELFPSNTTLTALSGTQTSGGQPYPTIGVAPWYDDVYKAQYWSELASQQSNALRVYKSGNLTFGIYPGNFRKADGTIISYGGSGNNAVSANTTVSVWLDNTGAVASGVSFPSASDILRLATVTTDSTGITGITNQRVVSFSDTFGAGTWATTGALATTNANVTANTSNITANTTAIALRATLASPTFSGILTTPAINGSSSVGLTINGNSSSGVIFSSGPIAFGDGTNITLGASGGTQIGTASTQKLGFYGTTAITRPSGNLLTALGTTGLGLVASPTIAEADVTNLSTDLSTINASIAANTTSIALKANISTPSFTGATFTLADAQNVVIGTTTGTKIGTATSQKLGFFGSTAVVQPSGSLLTAIAALGLISAPTIAQADVTGLPATLNTKSPLASPTFSGTLTAPIIAGTSGAGLTLNGASSTGIIISGDAANVSINGTTTINNKALTISYGPTGGVAPFQIVDGSSNNLMSVINYSSTNNAMVMSGKVIAQVSGSTAYFTNDPTVTTIFRGLKTTFGDASNPYALSSGVDNCVTISPNYKQSGTAGGTDLLINRIQTGTGYAVGSGPQKLIDAQVDSVSKFSIDNTGKSIFRGDVQVYGSTTNVSNQYPLTIQDSTANNLFLFNSYGSTNNRILIGGYSTFQQVGSTTYLAPDNTGNLQIGSPIIATQSMTVAGNVGFGTTTPRWMCSLGSALTATKLALYDNNTGSAFYGFGVQAGYVVATANDVQAVYFCAANGGSLGVHNASPQTYVDIAGAVAPAAVGVEDMLYLTKPTQGGVSFLEMAGFALGRWATTGAFEPKSRLDIKLKDAASSTAVPEVTVMTLQSNGSVGIGQTLPTATLDLKASTTTVASLRIRSGTAPTTPNDGEIWYDGTNIKIRVGGTTKTFTIT